MMSCDMKDPCCSRAAETGSPLAPVCPGEKEQLLELRAAKPTDSCALVRRERFSTDGFSNAAVFSFQTTAASSIDRMYSYVGAVNVQCGTLGEIPEFKQEFICSNLHTHRAACVSSVITAI